MKEIAGVVAFVGTVILFVVGLGYVIVSGDAEYERKSEAWRQNPANPINVCIAQGGVPITSAWDGRLKQCQFK